MSARHLFARLRTPVSADLISQNGEHDLAIGVAESEGSILPGPISSNVSYKGRMVDGQYQPENHEWGPILTEEIDGKSVGLDPMKLDLEVLIAAGHGRRRTSSVVAAIDMPVDDDIRAYRDIRKHCLDCSSDNEAEVRRCPIYDCAAWPYRMGKNPHNPRRGKNPFPEKATSKPENPIANDNRQDQDEHVD